MEQQQQCNKAEEISDGIARKMEQRCEEDEISDHSF